MTMVQRPMDYHQRVEPLRWLEKEIWFCRRTQWLWRRLFVETMPAMLSGWECCQSNELSAWPTPAARRQSFRSEPQCLDSRQTQSKLKCRRRWESQSCLELWMPLCRRELWKGQSSATDRRKTGHPCTKRDEHWCWDSELRSKTTQFGEFHQQANQQYPKMKDFKV